MNNDNLLSDINERFMSLTRREAYNSPAAAIRVLSMEFWVTESTTSARDIFKVNVK